MRPMASKIKKQGMRGKGGRIGDLMDPMLAVQGLPECPPPGRAEGAGHRPPAARQAPVGGRYGGAACVGPGRPDLALRLPAGKLCLFKLLARPTQPLTYKPEFFNFHPSSSNGARGSPDSQLPFIKHYFVCRPC